MPSAVLALNAGSSSIKFAAFESGGDLRLVVKGELEGLGAKPAFAARDGGGAEIERQEWADTPDTDALLARLLDWVQAHLGADRLVGAGHRVVHGGQGFTAPVRIDRDTLAALDALTPLAPLHQPHSLAPVRRFMELQPDLPQVACFDTAFHATMPELARRLPLPREYWDQGVRRYGFHGLSYEFIAGRLREAAPALAAGCVVVAHLGNGASLCAMRDGKSVDTTMSFTALDGLVMGTRCGTLDPGVVLYLMQEQKLSADAVETLLYKQSGLLGVSGIASDMRRLTASKESSAREAVELFVYRIAQQIAVMAASMGGIDGIVFTAGIGEHAPDIRAAVCERLGWLGVALDTAANSEGAGPIAAADSRVALWVIPTDEELMIARHTRDVLGEAAA